MQDDQEKKHSISSYYEPYLTFPGQTETPRVSAPKFKDDIRSLLEEEQSIPIPGELFYLPPLDVCVEALKLPTEYEYVHHLITSTAPQRHSIAKNVRKQQKESQPTPESRTADSLAAILPQALVNESNDPSLSFEDRLLPGYRVSSLGSFHPNCNMCRILENSSEDQPNENADPLLPSRLTKHETELLLNTRNTWITTSAKAKKNFRGHRFIPGQTVGSRSQQTAARLGVSCAPEGSVREHSNLPNVMAGQVSVEEGYTRHISSRSRKRNRDGAVLSFEETLASVIPVGDAVASRSNEVGASDPFFADRRGEEDGSPVDASVPFPHQSQRLVAADIPEDPSPSTPVLTTTPMSMEIASSSADPPPSELIVAGLTHALPPSQPSVLASSVIHPCDVAYTPHVTAGLSASNTRGASVNTGGAPEPTTTNSNTSSTNTSLSQTPSIPHSSPVSDPFTTASALNPSRSAPEPYIDMRESTAPTGGGAGQTTEGAIHNPPENNKPDDNQGSVCDTEDQVWNSLPQEELIFSLSYYVSMEKRRPLKAQEFHFLGSQPLTALRDAVYCLVDQLPSASANSTAFFYIGGSFFYDERFGDDSTCHHIQAYLRHRMASDKPLPNHLCPTDTPGETDSVPEPPVFPPLPHPHTSDAGSDDDELGCAPFGGDCPFPVIPMGSCKFQDLQVRLGHPYLYYHQGGCEHLIVFQSIRAAGRHDVVCKSHYPVVVDHYTSYFRRKCIVCDVFLAQYVCRNDPLSPCDPAFFCEKCYLELHYSSDGTLLTTGFEVYPYYHE
eukprot:Rmarinus@m.7003